MEGQEIQVVEEEKRSLEKAAQRIEIKTFREGGSPGFSEAAHKKGVGHLKKNTE